MIFEQIEKTFCSIQKKEKRFQLSINFKLFSRKKYDSIFNVLPSLVIVVVVGGGGGTYSLALVCSCGCLPQVFLHVVCLCFYSCVFQCIGLLNYLYVKVCCLYLGSSVF